MISLRAGARAWLVACAIVATWTLHAATRGPMPTWLVVAGVVATVALAPAIVIAALRWIDPPISAMMLVTRRRLARTGVPSALAYEWIPLEQVSRTMWLAAIAAEDAYFRDHSGFDWESLRDAHAHNQIHERKRGGSTISQQVAKNLFLWPARSYVRKALEAYLTTIIEALWPKRRILEVYLNIAQFGDDLFGVRAAARRYFDKRSADITATEAALLAAALPNPVLYRPDAVSHQMRFRQTWVLAAMRRLGDLYLERL